MIANLETDSNTDSRWPSVALVEDTSVPYAFLTEYTSAGKFGERDASRSRRHDRIVSGETHVSRFVESELRIALITMIKSESAEPFLCDHNDRGLLGLHTIEQRLDEGRYTDARSFWLDVDECLSVCATSGRHPFMVWEMRTLCQQLEEEFWEHLERAEVSPTTSVTERYTTLVDAFSSILVHQPLQLLVHEPLHVLEDVLSSTKTALFGASRAKRVKNFAILL